MQQNYFPGVADFFILYATENNNIFKPYFNIYKSDINSKKRK